MARTERADTPPFDLRRFLPRRAAEVLGIPGAAVFRPHRELVAERAAHVASVRALSDVELRSEAREASAPRRLAALAEAVERALGHPPYDEQLLAVAALIDGYAVEMDTGEGKTLVGAMAAASHALAGRRVHVLSVNDYLARRDAEWMTPLFDLLGLRVGSVGQTATTAERRDAYAAPIVYAPISEVGYDVLRDRQVSDTTARVAPVFDVAIVDEADAVMIDEAMVPLVLAGTGEKDAQDLLAATEIVADLADRVHYAVDEDGATVSLTDAGLDRIENRLGGVNLFDLEHSALLTRINLALHARALVHRDVDYLVTDGRIRLVNTARGRIAELQRWPDGLHAAVEAKEGLDVTPPGVILDTITVQDLLLRYWTLSGMSGTILAVAQELMEFYRLRSGRVERHRPGVRVDEPLRVLATSEEKKAAVVAEIARRHAGGQPVLVGTQSIAESEELAGALPAQMRARVLNARNDEQEAALVARAGEVGAVTISTQMSGRGTDIRLGGADEGDRERVVAAGGLVVIATALYPSRRLDQQLRGRAGRQGDPGVSVSFASLHDDLVLQNATRRSLERIERGSLDARTRVKVAVEAQRIAETVRLGQHRGTWEYTRAIAAQREKVLAVRDGVLRGEQKDRLRALAADEWTTLAREAGEDAVDSAVRLLALYHLDDGWQEHLALLTEVRDGIHLRVLAGQNPAEEFHRIALREFHGFFEAVDAAVARDIRALTVHDLDDPLGRLDRRRPSATWTYMVRDDPFGAAGGRAGRLRDALLRRREG